MNLVYVSSQEKQMILSFQDHNSDSLSYMVNLFDSGQYIIPANAGILNFSSVNSVCSHEEREYSTDTKKPESELRF